jgi:hypothetical protein
MGKEMKFGGGLPKVGTELYAQYNGKEYKAKIIKDNDSWKGKVLLYNGEKYHSLSMAARAITLYSTNGWKFWTIKE